MVTEKQAQQVWRESKEHTRDLIEFCRDRFEHPIDAVMALVLGSGILAAQLGVPKETLLEGVALAFDTQRGGKEDADHVH